MQYILNIVNKLHQDLCKRSTNFALINRYIDQILFGFLLESTGYFPDVPFRERVLLAGRNPANFGAELSNLFRMYQAFFPDKLDVFKTETFLFTPYEIDSIRELAHVGWTNMSPFILGILAESQLNPDVRIKLGAHFTSQDEIEEIVEAVIFKDLRAEWVKILENGNETFAELFANELERIRILDPSCGCGNFLVVCLRKLLDLLREVGQKTDISGGEIKLNQFYGIEFDGRFCYLSYYSMVITRLRYGFFNREGLKVDYPTLRQGDAILNLEDPLFPQETVWPNVDYIVGNPPYLGSSRLRQFLGDPYCDELQRIYENRVPASADLCCYWIEKARDTIDRGQHFEDLGFCILKAAGFILPYGVKQGASRSVIDRVVNSCKIFYVNMGQDWEGQGAHVRVCFLGFGPGDYQGELVIDGKKVDHINSDLHENHEIYTENQVPNKLYDCFMGCNVPEDSIVVHSAVGLIFKKSQENYENAVSLRPYMNGFALVRVNGWNPDWTTYGAGQFPDISTSRYLVTPRVSKHCVTLFLDSVYIVNNGVNVFSTDDYMAFGILQSKVYEIWTLGNCGWRGDSRQFRKITCFDSFTFPDLTSNPQLAQEICCRARELDHLRNQWLYPDNLFRQDFWEFTTRDFSVWKYYITESIKGYLGVYHVRFPRLVPINSLAEKIANKLTLSSVYNSMPEWLRDAHRELDLLVYQAYGWDKSVSSEEVIKNLQELRDLNKVRN